jgi:uncharacterized protein with LGFP repeats
MNHPKAPARRRLSKVVVAVGLTVSSLAAGLTFTQGTASAQVANIPGCGSFDFEPAILWVYGTAGAQNSQLGCPTGNSATTPDGVGMYHHFQRGSIYWKKSEAGTVPHIVLDPIRLNWAIRGWETSFLGWPLIDSFPIMGPNNELGVFTNFEGGSIFTSSAGTFEVHGEIRDKLFELGVETVGFPTSDETDFPDGGRASHFTKAGIYWWPDTGPVFLKDDTVVVNYSGLLGVEEMDWDQGSNSDEPYVTVGAVAPRGGRTIQSSIYDDVDSGEGRSQVIEVYRGRPEGIDLSTVVMEHDFGDPNQTRAAVTVGVGIGMSALIGAGVVASDGAAAFAAPVLWQAVPEIARGIDGALGLGDDHVGSNTRFVSARDMIFTALGGTLGWQGVTYSFYDGLFTGGGSRYGAGFLFRTT